MKNAQTSTDCSLCDFNHFVVLNYRYSVRIGCYGVFSILSRIFQLNWCNWHCSKNHAGTRISRQKTVWVHFKCFDHIVFSQTIMTPKLKVFPIFSDDGSFDAAGSICLRKSSKKVDGKANSRVISAQSSKFVQKIQSSRMNFLPSFFWWIDRAGQYARTYL